jgi:hypothetical protein
MPAAARSSTERTARRIFDSGCVAMSITDHARRRKRGRHGAPGKARTSTGRHDRWTGATARSAATLPLREAPLRQPVLSHARPLKRRPQRILAAGRPHPPRRFTGQAHAAPHFLTHERVGQLRSLRHARDIQLGRLAPRLGVEPNVAGHVVLATEPNRPLGKVPWGANTRSRGNLVLVDEPTEEIAPPNVRHDANLRDRRSSLGSQELKPSMRPLPVVVLPVGPQNPVQMPGAEDQLPVPTVGAQRLHPAL